MNIKELNEKVKENQKNILEETIEEIENRIVFRAEKGLNNIEISTDSDSYDSLYTIDKWKLEPLKEHFENEGYKTEIKEIKNPTKWFDKMLCIYEPEYLMVISWKEINDKLIKK